MLNAIKSKPALAFASRMACRSEPAPPSFVLLTTKLFLTAWMQFENCDVFPFGSVATAMMCEPAGSEPGNEDVNDADPVPLVVTDALPMNVSPFLLRT
jgi:hypothetical protein